MIESLASCVKANSLERLNQLKNFCHNMLANPLVRDLLEKYSPIWALNHSTAVLNWDLETNMPEEAAKARAFASAQLALMRQKLILSLNDPLHRASQERDLDDYEKGVIRVLKRHLDYNTKIPPSLVEALQKIKAESTINWRIARKKSDYRTFQPYLEKMIELKREEADKLGYDKHPYDALLDLGEEGLTVRDMDSIFSKLIPNLKRILSKVTMESRFPSNHPLESVKYDSNAVEEVNKEILKILGMPEKKFRMDVSTHPFTTSIALNDVRITTRYEGINFKSSIYSTIHEAGHAIYGLQVNQDLEFTPLRNGASSGVHESQSRFWENVVGRSMEFTKMLTPLLKEKLSFLSGYDSDQLYYYFNSVRPSLIRVDADELTYNFHIALRYEIEKKILEGKVSVSEIPQIWSDTIGEFLGVKPPADSMGALQDVHWSSGSFGNFPSYTIGNVVDGLIWQNIRKNLDLDQIIRERNFGELKNWLGENIHQWGGTYAPKDLLMKTFSEEYNPEYLVRYLEKKYLAS